MADAILVNKLVDLVRLLIFVLANNLVNPVKEVTRIHKAGNNYQGGCLHSSCRL